MAISPIPRGVTDTQVDMVNAGPTGAGEDVLVIIDGPAGGAPGAPEYAERSAIVARGVSPGRAVRRRAGAGAREGDGRTDGRTE